MFAYWAGAPLPAWDTEQRLREMERDSVEVEVLSAPTVYTHLDDNSAEYCRLLNDFQAELAQREPERFRSFVHLPVNDVDAALRELSRWSVRKETAGVVLGSNMGGLYPGDASLLPIWAQLERLGMPVLIHPVTPPKLYGPTLPTILQFPMDSTMAAASIIYSGLFERHPKLDIIIPHYGGVLPFLRTRLDMAVDIKGFELGGGEGLPRRPSEYVDHFHLDMAQGFHKPSFDCACSVVGTKKILYGSDHFFFKGTWRQQLNAFIDDLGLSPSDRHDLLRGNAERILYRI